MRSGRRNEKIIIKSPASMVNDNEYGEKRIFFIDFSKPWAFIDRKKGREYFAGEQINNTNPMEITINYNKAINDKFRVVHDGHTYEISNVSSFKKRNETRIICSEIT